MKVRNGFSQHNSVRRRHKAWYGPSGPGYVLLASTHLKRALLFLVAFAFAVAACVVLVLSLIDFAEIRTAWAQMGIYLLAIAGTFYMLGQLVLAPPIEYSYPSSTWASSEEDSDAG